MGTKTAKITTLKADVLANDLILLFRIRTVSSNYGFSRVKIDIYFDNRCIKSFYPVIPYSPKGSIFTIKCTIDLENVRDGQHIVRIVLKGLGYFKGISDIKQTPFNYDAKDKQIIREEKPKISKIHMSPITVIPKEIKKFFDELEKRRRKELLSKSE